MNSKEICVRFNNDGKVNEITLPLENGATSSLEALLAACSPATFGRDGKDVLDESYRKAGKLDATKFATTFYPCSTGMIAIVNQLLLPKVAGGESRNIKAELYKLNVYSGPSGKFESHVDTPRALSQICSLVIALPVAHQGGELVVRKGGKEVFFDWSSDTVDEAPVIKCAAFYSDCEHEVLEVKSGHRVTLTYNLYSTIPVSDQLAGNSDGLLDPTHLPLYEPLKLTLDTPSFL